MGSSPPVRLRNSSAASKYSTRKETASSALVSCATSSPSLARRCRMRRSTSYSRVFRSAQMETSTTSRLCGPFSASDQHAIPPHTTLYAKLHSSNGGHTRPPPARPAMSVLDMNNCIIDPSPRLRPPPALLIWYIVYLLTPYTYERVFDPTQIPQQWNVRICTHSRPASFLRAALNFLTAFCPFGHPESRGLQLQ